MAPTEPLFAFSLKDLEERFAGRLLAWTGGLALIAAAIFFLSLAFSRGWIGEELRVVIGLVFGAAAFGWGSLFLFRRNMVLGNVLTAVGLGIVSIALMAATRLYELVPPELGLLGALAAAAAAATIAVRTDGVIVAMYGLVAALVAPPLVGASPTLVTLAFVGTTLVGTTGVALYRSWRWLPPLAFVLSAPQLASWIVGDPDPAAALVALAGFWLVHAVAAAGEEARIRRDDLRASSATLVLADAVLLVWGGFVVLAGDLEPWRGTFLALVAAAHLVLGAWFIVRQGQQHLFANLVSGTGVAALTLAVPVQLGAPLVPLAWTAEAVALAWLAVQRRHVYSAGAALVLGALSVAHLLVIEYPVGAFGRVRFEAALMHPELVSLAAIVVGLVLVAALVPVRWVRSALAGLGILLVAYAMPFEMEHWPLVTAFVGLAVLGVALDRAIARLPVDASLSVLAAQMPFAWFGAAAAGVAGALALVHVLAVEYPLGRFGRVLFETPLAHPELVSLAAIVVGLVLVAALVPVRWVRSALAGLGILLVAYAMPFEMEGAALAATMGMLLVSGLALDDVIGRLRSAREFEQLASITRFAEYATGAGAVAWAYVVAVSLDGVLAYRDWGTVAPPGVPFSDERALVGLLLVAAPVVVAGLATTWTTRRIAVAASGLVLAYLIPFEVYADGVAVLWCLLAVLGVAVARIDQRGRGVYLSIGAVLVAGASAVAWIIVAPPDRLVVADPAIQVRSALLPGWPAAFAALTVVYGGVAHLLAPARLRAWVWTAAAVTAVYLASVATVDAFQTRVGGEILVEELAKQAQVALSILWTALGVAALVVGLARSRPLVRELGLALLVVASAKVFLVDLSALDVAYRVLSFGALGLLLLVSAWLFTRFRGPRSGTTGVPGGVRPA